MKVRHFTFITTTLAVLMLLVGFFIVEANATECYYSRVLCTGWCSLSSYCVPAPTSLTNIGGCTGDRVYTAQGEHCGTCVSDIWPHWPTGKDCGPPKAVEDFMCW